MGFLKAFSLAKLIVVLLMAVFFARYFLTPALVMNSLLHGVVLVFHEAGHMMMIFLGEFLTILGGTFWQIAIPIILTLYFLLSRQMWSASLVLFFVAFSLLDASIYVADAMERALPLITDDPDTHDWWNLLFDANLLRYDNFMARLYYLEGLLFFLLALYLGVDFSRKEPVTPKRLYHYLQSLR